MATQHKSGKKHSRRYWQRHIRAQQASGLSRAEYCRQQHLSYHALTYWQRKVGRTSSAGPALVPVPVEKMLPPPGRGQGTGVKIILSNTVAIEVGDQFSPQTLHRVLAVLEQR